MSNILIFGGTTEGRLLATALSDWGHEIYLSVATTHGKSMVHPQAGLHLVEGRKTAEQMSTFILAHNIQQVVDATHPFAEEVSVHIRQAVAQNPRPLYRLLREKEETKGREHSLIFDHAAAAAAHLNATQGNILLTTGSKTLEDYTVIKNFRHRIFLRVLPMVASIEKALHLGYHPSRILALQGPFSKEFNKALFMEYRIQHVVTKESGAAGGFPEKAAAAEECGVSLVVLRRPREHGLYYSEILRELTE